MTDLTPDLQTEKAYFLPLDAIRPNPLPTQAVRRARFTRESLEALADSIAAHGVQQAIVVREVPPAKEGGARYEIVAGERRFLASKILVERNYAAPHVIPAFIRQLDDFQLREIALTENSNREDLHPLEEAQSYEDLLLKPVGGGDFNPPRIKGYTVDELAARVGKSRRYMFGRLKLLELIPEAREALLQGKLQMKVAEAIAHMPQAEQKRAVPEILSGWGGEPFSHRQAVAHLRSHFMLRLANAPFRRDDAALVPAAGPCTSCPKRTGANPELFDVGSSDDMCTDHACWESKIKAHADEVIAKAKAAGHQVVTAKEARKLAPNGEYSLINGGYRLLDKPAEDLTGTKKPLSKLLGTDVAGVVVVQSDVHREPIAAMKEADLKAALKAKGLLKPAVKKVPGQKGAMPTADEIKANRKRRVEEAIDNRLPGALWKHMLDKGSKPFADVPQSWLVYLLDEVTTRGDADGDACQIAVFGERCVKSYQGWADEIEGTSNVARALAMVLIANEAAVRWGDAKAHQERAAALAGEIGFDLVAFGKEVADEIDAAIAEELDKLKAAADDAKTAPKAPAKKAPQKQVPAKPPKKTAAKVPGVKYRDPETGSTWSGRGLQPKWLKEALANGKKLADFDTELTPEKALAAAVEGEKRPPAVQLSHEAAWPFKDAAPANPAAGKRTARGAAKTAKALAEGAAS